MQVPANLNRHTPWMKHHQVLLPLVDLVNHAGFGRTNAMVLGTYEVGGWSLSVYHKYMTCWHTYMTSSHPQIIEWQTQGVCIIEIVGCHLIVAS